MEFSCLNHQTFPYYNFFTRAPDDGRPEPLESSLGHLYDDTKNAQIRVQEDSQLFVQNQYKKKKKKLDSHELQLTSARTNTSNSDSRLIPYHTSGSRMVMVGVSLDFTINSCPLPSKKIRFSVIMS